MRCDLRTVKHSLQTVYPCCRSVRSVRIDTWFIRTVTVRVYWTTHPASSPFFLAYFSFRFPYYLKACYRLTTCIPSFPIQLFMVYIQLERRVLLALCYWSAGLDLVVLTFQLLLDCETVIFLFLVFFLLFFLCQFLSYFLDVFFASLPSLTQSPTPPPPTPPPGPLLQTRGNDHLLQTLRSTIPRSWLTQKVRAVLWSEKLCTDWRFSVMETLAVILNCRWQVKRLKVLSAAFGKRTSSFPPKKKNKIWGSKIEYNTKPKKNLETKEWKHLKRKDRLEEFYLFLQHSFLITRSLSPWNLDTHGTL